jgi:hypothetical protein
MVTVFKDLYNLDTPYHIEVDEAFDRIINGKSKKRIQDIRTQPNKKLADKLKEYLPCVLFSGMFDSRYDSGLMEHSGFIALDFDDVTDGDMDMFDIREELVNWEHTYALWLSPRATGFKVLIKIADPDQHKEHFAAVKEEFGYKTNKTGNYIYKNDNKGSAKKVWRVDPSGINVSRICYESYDPDLYINKDAKPYTKLVKTEMVPVTNSSGSEETFKKLVNWLVNKGDAFVTGERNSFVFKLASACCRFGLSQSDAESHILNDYSSDNTFTQKEALRAIKSAYKSNKAGTAEFDNTKLVEVTTRSEVKIEPWIDEDGKVTDVIYGAMVKDGAMHLYDHGYETVNGIGAKAMDELFKEKPGEITCLTGIGNYGKSTLLKWRWLLRSILYNEKFAFFSPEDNPPHEFYNDMVEILLGANCTPQNSYRPRREVYDAAYDWVSKRFFYVYPKNVSPSPQYTREKFLELIITESISGFVVDPWNQMYHDYSKSSNTSKYLEVALGEYGRFSQENMMYGFLIVHPKQLEKKADGNYPEPDIFDLNDGAMWNNKMDNITVYHKPFQQTDPLNPLCTFSSKKIRRQKIVGVRGFCDFEFHRSSRRFLFNKVDYLGVALEKKGIKFTDNDEWEEAPF